MPDKGEKLKACPYCPDGQGQVVVYTKKEFGMALFDAHVKCTRCTAKGPSSGMCNTSDLASKKAVQKWNRRTPAPDVGGEERQAADGSAPDPHGERGARIPQPTAEDEGEKHPSWVGKLKRYRWERDGMVECGAGNYVVLADARRYLSEPTTNAETSECPSCHANGYHHASCPTGKGQKPTAKDEGERYPEYPWTEARAALDAEIASLKAKLAEYEEHTGTLGRSVNLLKENNRLKDKLAEKEKRITREVNQNHELSLEITKQDKRIEELERHKWVQDTDRKAGR